MLTSFDYFAPRPVDSLLELLDDNGENAEILAGGTDLLVDIRNETIDPEKVINIKNIERFGGISNNEEGLTIGALVTCGELINSEVVRNNYPYLIEAALNLGSRQVRNRATVVGNLCNASPCADMARVLLCAEAEAVVSSSQETRTMPLEELFTGVKETSLADNEIVEAVRVPPEMANRPGGNKKLKRIKGHDLSLASVSMIKKEDSFNITIGSCSPTPALLADIDSDIEEEQLLEEVEGAINPIDDQRASKEYRYFMVKTYVKRLRDELG